MSSYMCKFYFWISLSLVLMGFQRFEPANNSDRILIMERFLNDSKLTTNQVVITCFSYGIHTEKMLWSPIKFFLLHFIILTWRTRIFILDISKKKLVTRYSINTIQEYVSRLYMQNFNNGNILKRCQINYSSSDFVCFKF